MRMHVPLLPLIIGGMIKKENREIIIEMKKSKTCRNIKSKTIILGVYYIALNNNTDHYSAILYSVFDGLASDIYGLAFEF